MNFLKIFLGKIPILKEFEWFEWFEWFGPSPIEPFNSAADGESHRRGERGAGPQGASKEAPLDALEHDELQRGLDHEDCEGLHPPVEIRQAALFEDLTHGRCERRSFAHGPYQDRIQGHRQRQMAYVFSNFF